MLVSTLDGHIYKWQLENITKIHKSELHKNASVLIKNIFPTSLLYEEVQIEVKKNKYLYLDFFLPLFNLAIEVQGQQHYTYSNFFNKNQDNFTNQKLNDKLKSSWCELNNIILIHLKYDEEPSEWRKKLLNLGATNANTGCV